jgi:hypothetical protein
MTSEEARALFDAALDDELAEATKMEFEAALQRDAPLRAEYQALRQVVHGAAALQQAAPSVDLLASVQEKLRVRSGGRFYRDRFSERQGRSALLTWILGGSLLLVLTIALWFSFELGLLGR